MSSKALCRKRSLGMAGYKDSSSDWKNTPQQLREQVDNYNAMPEAAQRRMVAKLRDDPAKVVSMVGMIKERSQALTRAMTSGCRQLGERLAQHLPRARWGR